MGRFIPPARIGLTHGFDTDFVAHQLEGAGAVGMTGGVTFLSGSDGFGRYRVVLFSPFFRHDVPGCPLRGYNRIRRRRDEIHGIVIHFDHLGFIGKSRL